MKNLKSSYIASSTDGVAMSLPAEKWLISVTLRIHLREYDKYEDEDDDSGNRCSMLLLSELFVLLCWERMNCTRQTENVVVSQVQRAYGSLWKVGRKLDAAQTTPRLKVFRVSHHHLLEPTYEMFRLVYREHQCHPWRQQPAGVV